MFDDRPTGLVDRVIRANHCPDGDIRRLTPAAFKLRKKEHDISFSYRARQYPTDAISAYNDDPEDEDWKLGRWTVAIEASDLENIPSVLSVKLDSPKKYPAHVSAQLNEHRTKKEEQEILEKLVELAKHNGLFI